MQLVEQNSASPHFTFPQVGMFPEVPANAGTAETTLSEMRIDALREAIRMNEVSFPSQIPIFPKHDRPDLQQKLVQLYFVQGWSCPKIGARYGTSRGRVLQILNTWKRRAVEVGWIQRIPPAESYSWLLEHPPVQVVLQQVVSDSEPPALQPVQVVVQPVVNDSEAPVIQPPELLSIGPTRLSHSQVPKRLAPQPRHRPRRKFDVAQIVAVLKELRAGRSVAQIAAQVGASESSIRIWKEQYGPLVSESAETRLLQNENEQLKGLLAKLGAIEETLINLIANRSGRRPESFMPFSGVSPHAESEHRESA
jgi:transposase